MHKLMRWAARIAPVAAPLSLLVIAGGVASAAQAGNAGPYTIHFEMQPAAPVVGENQAYLHIVDAAGKAVPGAHVTVAAEMQGMAMESQPAVATDKGNGVYTAAVSLAMAGQWHIKVAVHSQAGMGETAFAVTTGEGSAAASHSLPWPIIGGAALLAAVALGAVALKRRPAA